MRHTLAACLLLLAGCAHARITEWRDRSFTVCGNKWCDKECYQKQVERACPGSATLRGASTFSKVTGAMTDRYGNTTFAHSSGVCREYDCDQALNLE